MKVKEMIYRRAALIAEGFTTDAELDAMWRQDQNIAWRWFDQLWEQRQTNFNRELAKAIKERDEAMALLRPKVIAALAPSGGWKGDYHNEEVEREANKYRIKTAKEIKKFLEKKIAKK